MSDLENSREEFINEIGAIVEALRGFGGNIDSLSQLSQRNLTDEQRQAIITRRFEQERKEWSEKTNRVLAENAAALVNFGRSLSAAPGSFAPLNSVVNLTTKAIGGLLGGVPILGGVVKGLGEAAKFMIDTFQSAYGTFERLSDTGVVTTFESMRQSSVALGLTFADTEKVFAKTSKDIAMFGGSATTGRKLVESLGYNSELTRRQMQRLGISAEEVTEFQISYIAQQQRYTRGQLKDVNSLREGSEKYIKELDILSKLTGVSRKQLQSEQEARLRDARYRAGIASLGEKERGEIDKFLGILKQTAPTVEEGFKDLIASGGIPVTEAAKQVALTLQQGGMDAQKVALQLREGSMSGYQAFQLIAKSAGAAANATQNLTSVIGDNTIISKLFVEMRELEAKKSNMTEAEYNKQRKSIKDTIEATKGQNAALADTKTAMYNAGRNIELLATSSEFATKTMKFFAQGIEWITEKMYQITGAKLPEHLAAKQKERQLLEQEEQAKQTAIDAEKRYQQAKNATNANAQAAENKYLEKSREIDELEAKQKKAATLVEKEELEEKLKRLRVERAQAQAEFQFTKQALTDKNFAKRLEEQARLADLRAAQATRERERGSQTRIAAERRAGLSQEPVPQSEEVKKEQELVVEAEKELKRKQAAQGLLVIEKNTLLKDLDALRKKEADAIKEGNEAAQKRLKTDIENKENEVAKIDNRISRANDQAKQANDALDEAKERRDKALLQDIVGTASPSESREILTKKATQLQDVEKTEKDLLKNVQDAQKLMDEARSKVETAAKEASTGVRPGEKTVEAQTLRQRDLRLASNKLLEATQSYEESKSRHAETAKAKQNLQREITDLTQRVKTESEVDEKSIEDLVTFTGRSGSKDNFDKLDSKVSNAFESMAREYYSMTGGKKLQINSSFRSAEDQQRLYDEWVARGKTGNPVAEPGKSKHESGKAIDLNSDEVNFLKEKGLLKKYGFNTLDNDPPHIFMRNGGVIEARPGGTKVVAAEAGMNEAYVPLPNGKSIPVDIKNGFFRELSFNISEMSDNMGSLLKETNSNIAQSNERVVDRLEKLNIVFTESMSKLNEMVAVLESSRAIQKNLLDKSMT